MSSCCHTSCTCRPFTYEGTYERKKLGESKRLTIGSLDKNVNEGRYVNMLHWDWLKPLFASFSTEKERESVTKYSQTSNLSFRLAANNYDFFKN